MTDYSGSCLCGTAKFAVQGRFDSFYLCHCQHCQKDTGSAHAANLFSQSAKLTWLAGADSMTTFTLPGTRHNKSFVSFVVPHCQAPIRQVCLLFLPDAWILSSLCCQQLIYLHPVKLPGIES